jgi:hypothetical protein
MDVEGVRDAMRDAGTVEERALPGGLLVYGVGAQANSAALEIVIDAEGMLSSVAVADVFHGEYRPSPQDQREARSLIHGVIDGGAIEVRNGRTRWLLAGRREVERDEAVLLRSWGPWRPGGTAPVPIVEVRLS